MTTQRLPIPDGDDNIWGNVLNGFLGVEHNPDGSLKIRSDGSVATLVAGTVPTAQLGSGAASSTTYLRGDGAWATPASSTAPNASTVAPGLVQLAGDLGGSASAPTVPGLASKAPLASPTFTGTVTVPTPVNATDAATKTYVDIQVSSGTADATLTTKGKLQLAGDLAGTAAAPAVAKLSGVTLPSAAPVTGNVLTASSSTSTVWSTPAAGVVLDASAADILPDTITGSATAGSTGKAADAGHQHPLAAHDHTTTAKGGQIPIAGLSATGTASNSTYLRGDGAWATPSSTGAVALTTTAVQTSTYAAAANQLIPADATSGAFTVTLPASPADKSRVTVKKIDSSVGSVTVATSGSDVFNKTGGATSVSLTLQNQAMSVQYAAATNIWYVISDDIPLGSLTSSLNATYVGKATQVFNVRDYGARGDVQTYYNATASAGSTTVTVSSATPFTSADIGKLALVYTKNGGNAGTIATIAAVNSATSVTLSAPAGITAAGVGYITYGTDDSAAIQAALSAASAFSNNANGAMSGYVDVLVPGGVGQSSYAIAAQLTVPAGVRLDTAGTLYNLLPSRNVPCVVLASYATAKSLTVNALYGTGVQDGSTVSGYATSAIDALQVANAQGTAITPTALSANAATSGGTIAAGTFYYVVTGIDSMGGESVVSPEASVTTTGTTSATSLSWTGDASFASYRVYRGIVSRGQNRYWTTTSTSFTDTNAAPVGTGNPMPPGVAVRLNGFNHQIGRILVNTASIGLLITGADVFISSAELIGCTTAIKGQLASNIACAEAVFDTCGGTNNNGYASEGGLVLDNGCNRIMVMIKAFQTFAKVLSPVVNIGPYSTNSGGSMDITVTANNLGGSVLSLANVHSANIRFSADNTAYNGGIAQPLTNGVVYGSAVRSDVIVRGILDPTVTTPVTGTVAGYYEYLQNGIWTTSQPPLIDGLFAPSDGGYLAWSVDPALANNATVPTAGTVNLVKMVLKTPQTITKIVLNVITAGATLAAGQNFAGLYSSVGTQIDVTADQASSWNSTGMKYMSLGTSHALAAGTYYVAFLTNGTTSPAFARGSNFNAAMVNGTLAASSYRFATNATGQTTLPASLTLSSSVIAQTVWFVGLV